MRAPLQLRKPGICVDAGKARADNSDTYSFVVSHLLLFQRVNVEPGFERPYPRMALKTLEEVYHAVLCELQIASILCSFSDVLRVRSWQAFVF